MSPSSDSAQVEPLATLAAVFAVCVGVSLYAGVLDASLGTGVDPERAQPAADRVESNVTTLGVADPSEIAGSETLAPDGYRMNVTLTAGDRRWTAGPAVPIGRHDEAIRRLGVRRGPGTVRPGTLTVVVWS